MLLGQIEPSAAWWRCSERRPRGSWPRVQLGDLLGHVLEGRV